MQIGGGSTSGSIIGNVTNNGTIAFNRSDNVVFAGNISGGTFAQNGTGSVELTGTNSMTAVNVNTGTLIVHPSSVGAASVAVAVADSAAITFKAGSTNTVGTLTLGSATGVSNITFGLNGDPSTPVLAVASSNGFTNNTSSNTIINITNTGTLTTGLKPLISFVGSVQGTGGLNDFTLGSAPPRVVATLDLGVANSQLIQLNIQSINTITWTGAADQTTWDIGTAQADGFSPATGTANWKQTNGAQTTVYLQPVGSPGDTVFFDDTAPTNARAVTFSAALNPSAMTVTIGTAAGHGYSFGGTGSIAAGMLTISGGGANTNGSIVLFTNTGGNTFTNLNISGGTTVQFGDGTNTSSLSGAVNLATSSDTLIFNPGTGGTTFAGNITGSGLVQIAGMNTTVFTGTGNTYGAGTTINANSTLQIGNGSSSGSLPSSGGLVNNGTLVFMPGSLGLTYNDTISGTGSVQVTAAAPPTTVTLGGVNSYLGGTTITSAILSVSSLDVGGNPSGIGKSSSDPGNLVINGGALRYTGPGATTDRLFTVGPNERHD